MYLSTVPPIEAWTIPDGDAGVMLTARKIQELIELGQRDPVMQQLAAQLVKQAGADKVARSQTIVAWWQEHIRCERDEHWVRCNGTVYRTGKQPAGALCTAVEELHHARQILEQGYGDCDDFTIGLGVLHELAGIDTCLVIIAADPSQPQEFSHIYQVVRLGSSWLPMWTPVDAVNAAQPWGWQFPTPYRKQILC